MTARIALLTIGQSPRSDVVPEIAEHLPAGTEITEIGALDGIAAEGIARLAPPSPDRTLVTRWSDGRAVTIDRDFAVGKLREMAADVDEQTDLVALLCSSSFEEIPCRRPLILPFELLRGFLTSVRFPGRLGVVTPSPDQIDLVLGQLRDTGVRSVGTALSPYAPARRLGSLIDELRRSAVDAVVLDCFGYSLDVQRTIARALGRPAISVRSLLIRALQELLGAEGSGRNRP